jgi:ketosteroid isomerase-like protein
MRAFMAALFCMAVAAGTAAASDKTDVVAAVRHYVADLNKGDTAVTTADCAAPSAIIDEFPPHVWQGATGCADWIRDFIDFATKNAITDTHLTLRDPTRVDVTGDRAYVVVSANYDFKENGKPLAERGSIWTLTLQKIADAWRITGWAWARH